MSRGERALAQPWASGEILCLSLFLAQFLFVVWPLFALRFAPSRDAFCRVMKMSHLINTSERSSKARKRRVYRGDYASLACVYIRALYSSFFYCNGEKEREREMDREPYKGKKRAFFSVAHAILLRPAFVECA